MTGFKDGGMRPMVGLDDFLGAIGRLSGLLFRLRRRRHAIQRLYQPFQ